MKLDVPWAESAVQTETDRQSISLLFEIDVKHGAL